MELNRSNQQSEIRRMELRSRTVESSVERIVQTSSERIARASAPKPATGRFRVQWDLVFWMLASFATLYFSDFASHLLFNEEIKRPFLYASLLFLGVAVGYMMYAFRRYPGLTHKNWSTKAPVPVAVATATVISGGVCMTVAVWPVWEFLTLVILPVLFMGFISIISLFNL
ncbi:transmembrane protein 128-like [Halichondria panicea]|uniref:transmembrane protein 128-like n=1 Tax=Halichondria panicea TaxID=6063 RepID=UPI00312B6BA8